MSAARPALQPAAVLDAEEIGRIGGQRRTASSSVITCFSRTQVPSR